MMGIAIVALLIGFAVLVGAVAAIVAVLSSDDEDHVSVAWRDAQYRERRE